MKSRPIVLKNHDTRRRSFQPDKRTGYSRTQVEQLFATHIVELTFRRRILPPRNIKDREKGHMKYTRRMLCTSAFGIISDPSHRRLFKWTKPRSKRPRSWYRKKQLIIVWDLMLNSFRMISTDRYLVSAIFPLADVKSSAIFIDFYKKHVKTIPRMQKIIFADK
jgi:hypothetical protein